MSNNDNSSTLNLTIDALRSGSAVPLQSTPAATRDEVRANAKRMSTADRAKAIHASLSNAREKEVATDAAPESAAEPSEPTEPGPDASPEEEPSAAPAEDEQAHESDSDDEFELPDRLDELASAFELDADYVSGLTQTVKVNGEEIEVTVADAFAGYQHASANQEKARQLTATQRRMEAEHTERLAEVNKLYTDGQVAAAAAIHVIQQEVNAPEIQALKTSDPGEYLKWQAHSEQKVAQLKEAFRQLQARQAAILEEEQGKLKQAGLARLRDEIQDFDTPERYKKIESVFSEFGAGQEEIGSVLDDRIILLASRYADAKARLAELEQKDAAGKKKARQVVAKSKVANKSPRRSPAQQNADRTKAAKADIAKKRGHGRRRAIAGAIFNKIQEGRNRGR